MDEAYKARLTNGLLGALMRAGPTTDSEGVKTVVLPSAEIIDVMTTIIALLLRDSEGTATPTKTRRMVDEIARKLRARIVAAKKADSPFTTMQIGVTN